MPSENEHWCTNYLDEILGAWLQEVIISWQVVGACLEKEKVKVVLFLFFPSTLLLELEEIIFIDIPECVEEKSDEAWHRFTPEPSANSRQQQWNSPCPRFN